MNTRQIIERARQRGRRMANARWEKHRRRVEAEMPRRIFEMEKAEVTGEGRPLHPGEYFGTVEFRDWSGKVHRITLRQGHRKNSLQIDGCSREHGITWVLDRLRRKIVV